MPVWIESLSLHVSFWLIYSQNYRCWINSPSPLKLYKLLGWSPTEHLTKDGVFTGTSPLNQHVCGQIASRANNLFMINAIARQIHSPEEKSANLLPCSSLLLFVVLVWFLTTNSWLHLNHWILSIASSKLPCTESNAHLESAIRR